MATTTQSLFGKEFLGTSINSKAAEENAPLATMTDTSARDNYLQRLDSITSAAGKGAVSESTPLQQLLAPSVETPWRKTQDKWKVPSKRGTATLNPYIEQFTKLALAGGAIASAWHAPKLLGKNSAATWYRAARVAEEFSPGGIFSTFRISEAISPLVPKTKKINLLIDLSKLSAKELTHTTSYFKDVLNVTGGKHGGFSLAGFENLEFVPQKGKEHLGQIYGNTKGGKSFLLSKKTFKMMRLGRLFEAFTSVAQPGKYANELISKALFGGTKKNAWAIIPAASKARDALMGARTYAAASVQRLTELLSNVGKEIKIPGTRYDISTIMKKMGLSLTPKRGPALRSLFRLSGVGAKFGLAYLAVKSIDALKGSEDLPRKLLGVAGTTGAFSAAGAGVASILGKRLGLGVAVGAAASLLQFTPALGDGILPGIASIGPKANVLRANIGKYTGLSAWRRSVEQILPGASDPKLGLFMGTMGATAAYLHQVKKSHGTFLPFHRKVLPTVRKIQNELLSKGHYPFIPPAEISPDFEQKVRDVIKKGDHEKILKQSSARVHSLEIARRIKTEVLESQAKQVPVRGGMIRRQFQKFVNTARGGRIGAIAKGAALLGAGWYAATSGLGFGTLETPEELKEVYSGAKLIPVKRGQGWEFGRTPLEGGDTLYWRQHWLPRLLAKSKLEAQEEYTPIERTLLKNFTYDLEEEDYDRRPYPITSQFGDQLPFISPLIQPLARMIKPAKLMHVDEWARVNERGEIELKFRDSPLVPTPGPDSGGIAPSAPVSPYESKQMLRRGFYEMSELAGLVGYASQSLYGSVTGAQLPFAEDTLLQSSTEVRSLQSELWGAYTGGAFMGIPFMSESVRRYLPNTPSFLEKYSPIENDMPESMPEDLRYGDPYANIRYGLGEERLPGPLYDILYNTGGEYDTADRFRFLADAASYSPEFRGVMGKAKKILSRPPTSEAEAQQQADMAQTMGRYAAKKTRLDYDFYQSGSSGYGYHDAQGKLIDLNESTHQRGASQGPITRLWESFLHKTGQAMAPIEHVMPAGISPWAKLVGKMDPVEQYEQDRAYGKTLKMWDSPWENWVRPALDTAKRYWAGGKAIPEHKQEVRNTQSYYDVLKWYKYKKLKEAAMMSSDKKLTNQYETIARSTQFGANPYSTASRVEYAIPYSERKYFDAFSMATSTETQARITSIVPELQGRLYEGQWQRQEYSALQRQAMAGTITEEGRQRIQGIASRAKFEGMPVNQSLYTEYQNSNTYMDYADWFRMKTAETFFSQQGFPAPKWVVFNPAVDLEDVKLRQVMSQGQNHYDYDIFMNRVKQLGRKPYLFTDEVDESLQNFRIASGVNPIIGMASIKDSVSGGVEQMRYSLNPNSVNGNSVDIQFNVDNGAGLASSFN